MYMGHLAFGIAAKQVSRETPVTALVLATIAPDIGDIVLGLAGVHDRWWDTHTVPAAAVWVIVAGVIGLVAYGRAAAIVLAVLAATHVPLDYITSRMDVFPWGGPRIGLGLYERPAIDLAVEATVIVAGWWLYRRAIAADRRNHWSVFAIGAVMIVFQIIWATML